MIPPTFENKVFSRAAQRIYLSATLGAGGELERAFGRRSIVRLPLPTKTPPRSGRRLFVFPDLVSGGDPAGVAQRIIAVTDKLSSSAKTPLLRQSWRQGSLLANRYPSSAVASLSETGLARSLIRQPEYLGSQTVTTAWIYPAMPVASSFWMEVPTPLVCRNDSSVSAPVQPQ
jgi:hypothetical protein